jgi:hypothetical protein
MVLRLGKLVEGHLGDLPPAPGSPAAEPTHKLPLGAPPLPPTPAEPGKQP